jgi:hypothetical protein
LCGGGGDDFSHVYILIVHEYFGLQEKMQKMPKWA